MTKFIFILALFGSLRLLAQIDHVDQSELYKKYAITEVNAFYHDSNLVENDELWKIDFEGRMIYKENPTIDEDSLVSNKIWTYLSNKLVTLHEIYTRKTKSNKLDTALTTYFYNSENKLIREQKTYTYNQDTLIKDYEYIDGRRVKGKLYNPQQSWWHVTDSVIYYPYYPTAVIRFKSLSSYYNGYLEFKKEMYHDTLGILQVQLEYWLEEDSMVNRNVKTYIYENMRLSRIKEVKLGWQSHVNVSNTEDIFDYNDMGLVSKRTRLVDGEVIDFYTYDYK